jgi:hypothetical protein
VPSRIAQFERVTADELGLAVQHIDLALFGERREPIGEPTDDLVLPGAQPLAVDLR